MGAGGAAERLPRLVGGRLCLNFANTVGGRGGDSPDEYLLDYADLVAWARYVGIVDAAGAARLLAAADREPGAAEGVFRRAVALRETIYRVGSALAAGGAPRPEDLDALRRAHVDALGHARLVPAERGFGWAWEESRDDLARPLWPVARSAVELLTSPEVGRLKECPGGGGGPCTWLFLDTTKNAARRWCSMAECGGEVKARRQTARRRAARARGIRPSTAPDPPAVPPRSARRPAP